jgi:hypothetical protein
MGVTAAKMATADTSSWPESPVGILSYLLSMGFGIERLVWDSFDLGGGLCYAISGHPPSVNAGVKEECHVSQNHLFDLRGAGAKFPHAGDRFGA